MLTSRLFVVKGERVVAALLWDEGKLHLHCSTFGNVERFAHDGSAVDAQDNVAVVSARRAAEAGCDGLLCALGQIACDCEGGRGVHIFWDGYVDGQLIATDDGCQAIGISVEALLPASLAMRPAHYLYIIGAVGDTRWDGQVGCVLNHFVPGHRPILGND